jgi:hypothetical protein
VVSLRDESEGALLYNPDLDEVVLVNETGQLIWEAITEPKTTREIAAFIKANMVDAENILADVKSFIESLLPDFVISYDEPAVD